MANQKQLRWLGEGVSAWNKRRSEERFEVELVNADLEGADLRGANLQEANLQEANLQEANLLGADLLGADLRGANLQEANLLGANLRGANLRGANLRGADLQEADLPAANLQRAGLRGANLLGANLQRAKLLGAGLRGANLRGADLRGADLQEANLQGADLQRASLQGAGLLGANLLGANLQRANLQRAGLLGALVFTLKSARRSNNAGRADFSRTKNLTQNQLAVMRGDTGVLLPDGLVHPDNWAEFEWDDDDGAIPPEPTEPESSDDKFERPFVFLSYANEDRKRIALIRELLVYGDIPCWWDQDIEPGRNWAEEIQSRIGSASIILTFWTQNSVVSNAVKEEARKGQTARKLVHAKLDQSELPYGFGETQYCDLSNWKADPTDKQFLGLVQVLNDRLSPPDLQIQERRIASTGSASAVLQDGRAGITDTPPDGVPAEVDETYLVDRLEKIAYRSSRFLDRWDIETPNVRKNIKSNIERCKELGEQQDKAWYKWEYEIEIIRFHVKRDSDADWAGFDGEAEGIISAISELRPYLALVPKNAPNSDHPDSGPEIRFNQTAPDQLEQTADKINQIVTETGTSYTQSATEFLKRLMRSIKDSLQPTPETDDESQQSARDAKYTMWRSTIRDLAGYFASLRDLIKKSATKFLNEKTTELIEGLWKLLVDFFK